MTKIQGIIFDLYGTLIYLSKDNKIYAKLFSDLELKIPHEFKRAREIALTENFDSILSLVDRIKNYSPIDIDINLYEKELEKEMNSASIYSETIRILKQLKERNLKLGLISNLASPYKRPFFDLKLNEYFDEFLFSCDVNLKKPNPIIYEKMVNNLGINSTNLLMIGDGIDADVKGPQSVGMNAIHLDRNNNSLKSISNLEEIFKYL